MGQAEIVVDMVQNKLLAHADLTLAEGGHPSPDRGDMLTDAQVDALDKGRVALPATGRQPLLDRLQRAKHDSVSHADQPAARGTSEPPCGVRDARGGAAGVSDLRLADQHRLH